VTPPSGGRRPAGTRKTEQLGAHPARSLCRQTGRASNDAVRCPPSLLLWKGVEKAAASGAATATRNLTKYVSSLVWTHDHKPRD